jgi:hypothetical protein
MGKQDKTELLLQLHLAQLVADKEREANEKNAAKLYLEAEAKRAEERRLMQEAESKRAADLLMLQI